MSLPRVDNLGAYLPGLIALESGPMRLDNHFPFLPLFDTATPVWTTVRAGRQIGKTHQFAARLLIRSAARRGYKSLVVLPLQEQADRLSSQVFRPMIEDSPLRALLRADPTAPKGSVRVRPFSNRSTINFGYPGLTADRIRSLSAVDVWEDEAQDLMISQVSVIHEVQSSFGEPVNTTSGTSKTLDTLLERRWTKSSQAIWHIRCPQCGYDNRSVLDDGDVEGMLGPYHDAISEKTPGVVCRHCRSGSGLSPRLGRWVHRYPERAADHAGYHMPQFIFPAHYARPIKWLTLLNKRDGKVIGYNTARYINEALGEPYDRSVRLLAPAELEKACVLGPNTLEAAVARTQRYEHIVMGVDWGGGGQEGVSLTRAAVVGFAADGGADVIYGLSLPPGMDAIAEADLLLELAAKLNVGWIAHDFNGGGVTREAILTHRGFPAEAIAPVVYFDAPGAKLFRYVSATGARVRGFFHFAKSRGLTYIADLVRHGKVRFFNYDFRGEEDPGLVHDWNNYVANTLTSPTGKSVYRVVAAAEDVTTDFADASAMAIAFLYENFRAWPSPLA